MTPQIGDYLRHCRSRGLAFALITEFEPKLADDVRSDPRLNLVTYHTIAHWATTIRPRSDAGRGALALLSDYLRHEVTMYDRLVDVAALRFLATRIAGLADRNYPSRRRALPLNEVPQALHRVMSNIAWVGDELAGSDQHAVLDFALSGRMIDVWVGLLVRQRPWMQFRCGVVARAWRAKGSSTTRYEVYFFCNLYGPRIPEGGSATAVHRSNARWPEATALLRQFVALAGNALEDAQRLHPENSPAFWHPAKRAIAAMKKNIAVHC